MSTSPVFSRGTSYCVDAERVAASAYMILSAPSRYTRAVYLCHMSRANSTIVVHASTIAKKMNKTGMGLKPMYMELFSPPLECDGISATPRQMILNSSGSGTPRLRSSCSRTDGARGLRRGGRVCAECWWRACSAARLDMLAIAASKVDFLRAEAVGYGATLSLGVFDCMCSPSEIMCSSLIHASGANGSRLAAARLICIFPAYSLQAASVSLCDCVVRSGLEGWQKQVSWTKKGTEKTVGVSSARLASRF